MSDRIQVVSAAIVWKGRILLAQRSPDTSYPWCWCTPGGKVEPGEAFSEALRRELREELVVGLAKVELTALFSVELDSPAASRPSRLTCFTVDCIDLIGFPTPGDKTVGIGWFSAEELSRLDLAPADTAGREHLLRAMGENR